MRTQRFIQIALGVLAIQLLAIAPVHSARADEFGPDFRQFERIIDEARTSTHPVIRVQTVYDQQTGLIRLPREIVESLAKVSRSQSNIWADTILEGEYEADGNTRLDRIEAMFKGESLIAYRVTYSEKAWYLMGCQYDYQNKATLEGCQEGRIVESSYVSPGFTSWMRDEQAYAEFRE